MKSLSIALGALSLMLGAAHAAPQTVDFDVTLVSGPNTGATAVSTLEFDDGGLASGVLTVAPDEGNLIDLVLNVPFLGTFSDEDDVDFPDFPEFLVDLDTWEVTAIDYISDSGLPVLEILGLEGEYIDPASGDVIFLIINDGPQQVIPVPAAAFLFAPAIAALAARRRKASA